MGPLHGPGFRGFKGFRRFKGLWWRLRRRLYEPLCGPGFRGFRRFKGVQRPLGAKGRGSAAGCIRRLCSLRSGAQRARLQREG